MNVSLNLRSVLPKHRSKAELARAIGITENALKHLMADDAKTINQANLNKVIIFLIGKKLVNEADLPGALFSISYDSMWPLLTRRRHIGLAWGFRRDEQHGMEVVRRSRFHSPVQSPSQADPRRRATARESKELAPTDHRPSNGEGVGF